MRLGIYLGIVAVIAVLGWRAVVMIREDARADILRDLELRQIERTEADVAEREARKKEIENASPDELFRRACAGGLLPADACAETRP